MDTIPLVKFSIIIFSLFIAPLVEARLVLQIEIAHKRGIDQGLVISSELHSLEEMDEGGKVLLKMDTGLAIELWAGFAASEVFGPSSTVRIRGTILEIPGKYDGPTTFSSEIALGDVANQALEGSDELIAIKINPTSK